MRGQRLFLEEGLFWVLQERGWLHPYRAVWRWSVAADDPRLDELDEPVRDLRERVLLSRRSL